MLRIRTLRFRLLASQTLSIHNGVFETIVNTRTRLGPPIDTVAQIPIVNPSETPKPLTIVNTSENPF